MANKVRKELIGSKITKGHHTVIVDDSKECIKVCKMLKLDVFETVKKDVEPKSESK